MSVRFSKLPSALGDVYINPAQVRYFDAIDDDQTLVIFDNGSSVAVRMSLNRVAGELFRPD